MKECPVCHAKCFDDMEICYGCLSRLPVGDAVKSDLRSTNISLLSTENGGYRLTFEISRKEGNYLRAALAQ